MFNEEISIDVSILEGLQRGVRDGSGFMFDSYGVIDLIQSGTKMQRVNGAKKFWWGDSSPPEKGVPHAP